MKQKLTYLLLMLTNTTYSQTNLVPNGSFEVYDTCPNTTAQVSYAPPWYSPTNASPDYFNACATFSSGLSVPDNSNYAGYQSAKSGVAYVGFSPYITGIEYREYIQAPLLSTLIANKEYCVEFYLSFADSVKYAVTEIGAYFSNGAVINMSTASNLPYQPTVHSPVGVFLSDKVNWIKVSGSFIATGGENYITIGNFNNDSGTDTLNMGGSVIDQTGSYYYIDDISVYECNTPNMITTLNIPNVFTPNSDNNNDQFVIEDKGKQIKSITIYNRWGIKVFETNNINEAWDGRTISGIQCSEGVYYYVLQLNDNAQKNIQTKGFIQLIR